MLSEILTTLFRTKSVFLSDKEGEEDASFCCADDVRKLIELEAAFVF